MVLGITRGGRAKGKQRTLFVITLLSVCGQSQTLGGAMDKGSGLASVRGNNISSWKLVLGPLNGYI